MYHICTNSSLNLQKSLSLKDHNFQEYTGEDDSDLFLEERERSLQSAQAEKRRIQLSVPGILNPHEVPEEMQD